MELARFYIYEINTDILKDKYECVSHPCNSSLETFVSKYNIPVVGTNLASLH